MFINKRKCGKNGVSIAKRFRLANECELRKLPDFLNFF